MQISNNIADLAAQLGYATDAAGNFIGVLGRVWHAGSGGGSGFIALSEQLDKASITTVQSLVEQTDALIALKAQMTSGSMEYEQLTKKIYGLQTGLIDARIAASDFQARWEEMHNRVFSKGSQFQRDVESVTEAIQNLSYYGIDLGTTDVDEQIGQQIRRMMDFRDTLNPQSQAYADMGAQIDELVAQYTALGGIVPEVADAIAETDLPFTESRPGSSGTAGWWEDVVLTWDDVAQGIIDDFAADGDITQAVQDWADLVAALLTLGIDIDTTLADEALAGLIADTETWLGTLEPGSPEYLEALRGLTLLAQLYAQLTGDTTALRNAARAWRDYMADIVENYNDIAEQHGLPEIPTSTWGSHGSGHQFGGMLGEEVPFLGRPGEYVLRDSVVGKFGETALDGFNATLDSSALHAVSEKPRATQTAQKLVVKIYEPGPRTWAQVGDKVYKRLNQKRRYFESGESM